MKRRYELTVILSPQLSSIDLKKKLKTIESLIEKQDGKVIKKEDWGKKTLIYAIAKEQEGIYRHFTVELPGEAISKLDKQFKLTDGILRYLFVIQEDK